MSAIQAAGVTHRFGDVVAVHDASLAVAPGEIVGLVGPNGAGKTTLIRVLLGLLAPVEGAVVLAGGAPSRVTREQVGYVPQSLGLWLDLSLAEHLAMVGAVYGRSEPMLDGALAAVADQTIGRLPLGLRRRAAFAVALSHVPEVLILDEPTSGVDPLARDRLWEVIRAAAGRGVATLVSTHYLDEAARCDRVVLMSTGRVVGSGTVAELIAGRSAVEVSTPSWERAWRLLEAADLAVLPAGRRLRVLEAEPERVAHVLGDLDDVAVAEVPATLEEVFLSITGGAA